MDVVCPRLVYVTIQYITTVNLLPHHFPLPPSPRSPPPALLSPILHHPPPPPRSRYYDLYHATAVALKAASNNTLRVGGPATSNTTGFLQPFLDAAKERGAPVDFLSSHKYPKSLAGRDEFPDTVAAAAAIAAANGLPYVLSEFNSGLGMFCCHDTHYAAAFLIRSAGAIQQRRLCRSSRGNTRTGEGGLGADDSGECDTGGTWKGTGTAVPDVMSFWTFSDVFEEVRGVDANAKRAPFHNAYGLVTMDGIPKASFRALQLLRRMPNETVAVERISRVGGRYAASGRSGGNSGGGGGNGGGGGGNGDGNGDEGGVVRDNVVEVYVGAPTVRAGGVEERRSDEGGGGRDGSGRAFGGSRRREATVMEIRAMVVNFTPAPSHDAVDWNVTLRFAGLKGIVGVEGLNGEDRMGRMGRMGEEGGEEVPGVEGRAAPTLVNVSAVVERIDASHGNAWAGWTAQGRPKTLNGSAVNALIRESQLVPVELPVAGIGATRSGVGGSVVGGRVEVGGGGGVEVEVTLVAPGISAAMVTLTYSVVG